MPRPHQASAAERAHRLIALLGRLQHRDTELSLAELAAAVGTTPDELARDLTLLSMCGIAPYGPDDLMPIMVEDETVLVFGEAPALEGTVRLSADEARALAAALQAAGFNATDPLVTRLLAAAAAGIDAETVAHAVRPAVSGHDSAVYQALAAALDAHEVVRIEYQRGGTLEISVRDIEPGRLFAERGVWYVSGWCRTAGGVRTFRLDRIRSAVRTDEQFEARASAANERAFDERHLPRAVLAFSDPDQFEPREWPGCEVANGGSGGSLRVSVPYSGTAWIARQVVSRLGEVTVLEPPEVRVAVAELARAELARLEG